MTLVHGYVSRHETEPELGSPWPGRELAVQRRTVRHAATLPLAVLLAVQWLFLVAGGLPETSALPGAGLVAGASSARCRCSATRVNVGLLLALQRRLDACWSAAGQRVGRAWLAVPTALGTLMALLVLVEQAVAGLSDRRASVIVVLVWLAHDVVGRGPRRPRRASPPAGR